LWIWRDDTRDNKGTGLVLSRNQSFSLKYGREYLVATDCTDDTDEEGFGFDAT
jgi:hypothetical protein